MKRPYGRAVKAKGRRLQVTTAVCLALRFNLSIEATPPTKPGLRNGVLWVPETENPDLRVRVMGQPGPDVVLVSPRARQLVSLGGYPAMFETKNVEDWDFGPAFWKDGENAFLWGALEQAWKAAWKRFPMVTPVVILGKNRWPPLAAWAGDSKRYNLSAPALICSGFGLWPNVMVTPLQKFVGLLDGAVPKLTPVIPGITSGAI